MLRYTNESNATPGQRVESLTSDEQLAAIIRVVSVILEDGNTRRVPDVLNEAGLLARWEVYDADHAWTELEDLVHRAARYAVA